MKKLVKNKKIMKKKVNKIYCFIKLNFKFLIKKLLIEKQRYLLKNINFQ